jgi:peptidoglycan/LPS O-acetylase OafA/YrhL
VFVYDMLHPMGLAAERLATFMLGLVAYMFGWAIRNGRVWPRWLAWMAWVVALVNAAVALIFSEFSNYMYCAQGLFVLWLTATAVVMLAERRQPPTTPSTRA